MSRSFTFINIQRRPYKGWQLRKKIHGVDISKYFSDSRYGNKAMSLVAAIMARELFFNQR